MAEQRKMLYIRYLGSLMKGVIRHSKVIRFYTLITFKTFMKTSCCQPPNEVQLKHIYVILHNKDTINSITA